MYLAVRVTFFLPDGLGALDPGPSVDWINFPYLYR